jgi:hypothetical protein
MSATPIKLTERERATSSTRLRERLISTECQSGSLRKLLAQKFRWRGISTYPKPGRRQKWRGVGRREIPWLFAAGCALPFVMA